MKNKLKILLAIFVLVSVSYLLYSIVLKNNKIIAEKEKINELPKFSFTSLSGNNFSNSDLDTNKYTLMIYFSTNCIYCEKQIENITEKYKLLKNTQVILITTEKKEDVIDFTKKFNLKNYRNISVVFSNIEYFIKEFGTWNPPSIFLYSPDKHLLFLNEGVLDINSILSHY